VRRLVLVGGGHAHLEVLRQAARRPFPHTEITLLSPFPAHQYSSMVPGYLRGAYAEPDLTFDLVALAHAAGARFVEAYADRVEPAERVVEAGGMRLEFDVASLDVGADAAGLHLPGASEHAHPVRPMGRAVDLHHRLERLVAGPREPAIAACVVGGGAAGAEVAWAVHARIARAGRRPLVTLVEREPLLLPEYAPAARRRARRLLDRRGIAVSLGREVRAVGADSVTLDGGESIASALTVWLTGAAPSAVIRCSPLAKDARGFVSVDATLREATGAPVWGAGDCVTPRGHPDTPKAGVYAVRAAPVLAANLRAACEGRPAARTYVPQPHFLALLDTADDRALLRWHGVLAHSRAAWRLKRWIDRRFVRRYQRVYGAD
jgi:selenide,water dikinase